MEACPGPQSKGPAEERKDGSSMSVSGIFLDESEVLGRMDLCIKRSASLQNQRRILEFFCWPRLKQSLRARCRQTEGSPKAV